MFDSRKCLEGLIGKSFEDEIIVGNSIFSFENNLLINIKSDNKDVHLSYDEFNRLRSINYFKQEIKDKNYFRYLELEYFSQENRQIQQTRNFDNKTNIFQIIEFNLEGEIIVYTEINNHRKDVHTYRYIPDLLEEGVYFVQDNHNGKVDKRKTSIKQFPVYESDFLKRQIEKSVYIAQMKL